MVRVRSHEPRLHLGDRGELQPVVEQVLVDVVGHDPDVRVLQQHVRQRLDLVLRVGRTSRVRRRVEDQPLRLRRDGGLERGRLQAVAVLQLGVDEHRLGVGQHDDVGVRHPAWRRDDHLIARVQRRQQRIVDDLLAAGADRDLVGLVVEVVLALELAHDRRLELGRAVDVGVLGLAFRQRLDRRLLDVVGRVEVWLARRQRDDIATGGLELACFHRRRDGRGGLNAIQAVGDEAHRSKPFARSFAWARAARTLSAARGDFNTSRVAISARLDPPDSRGDAAASDPDATTARRPALIKRIRRHRHNMSPHPPRTRVNILT